MEDESFVSVSELLTTGRSAGLEAEDGGAIDDGATEDVLNGDDVALTFDGIVISFEAGRNIEADIAFIDETDVGELSRPFGDSSEDRLRFITILIGRFFGGRARFFCDMLQFCNLISTSIDINWSLSGDRFCCG